MQRGGGDGRCRLCLPTKMFGAKKCANGEEEAKRIIRTSREPSLSSSWEAVEAEEWGR